MNNDYVEKKKKLRESFILKNDLSARTCCALVHWSSTREELEEVQYRGKEYKSLLLERNETQRERMGLRKRKAVFPCVCAPGLSFCGNTGQTKAPQCSWQISPGVI